MYVPFPLRDRGQSLAFFNCTLKLHSSLTFLVFKNKNNNKKKVVCGERNSHWLVYLLFWSLVIKTALWSDLSSCSIGSISDRACKELIWKKKFILFLILCIDFTLYLTKSTEYRSFSQHFFFPLSDPSPEQPLRWTPGGSLGLQNSLLW